MSELLKLLPEVRGAYRINAELKNWFNIKTTTEILFRPKDIADLQHFLKNISKEIPLTILGAASNVIIKDSGIKGVTIRLGGEFAQISHNENFITAGAACLCGNAALYSKNAALAGLEFLTGIPGSIGGAVAMNAGCYDSDVSQTLISAKALDFKGNLVELKRSDFEFSYRENKIAKNFIFVEATFKGTKSTSEIVAEKINEFNSRREAAQPIRAKTGGSTFKNPINQTTKKSWQLIDEAGCRGLTKNDAQMSVKHCNFMINNGNASAQDLIDLGNEVKRKVKEKTDINLEWEIKILG
ncbi:MAG: UDP-N-acetylmuramate dehydrogenase [Rickettsiales bacterium]|nr:UDP-N-acetylmuramate dehydrogenase [Rickettsiales bacterium]